MFLVLHVSIGYDIHLPFGETFAYLLCFRSKTEAKDHFRTKNKLE